MKYRLWVRHRYEGNLSKIYTNWRVWKILKSTFRNFVYSNWKTTYFAACNDHARIYSSPRFMWIGNTSTTDLYFTTLHMYINLYFDFSTFPFSSPFYNKFDLNLSYVSEALLWMVSKSGVFNFYFLKIDVIYKNVPNFLKYILLQQNFHYVWKIIHTIIVNQIRWCKNAGI